MSIADLRGDVIPALRWIDGTDPIDGVGSMVENGDERSTRGERMSLAFEGVAQTLCSIPALDRNIPADFTLRRGLRQLCA